MDGRRFDQLTRSVSTTRNRRQVVTLLAAGAAGGLLGLFRVAETGAKTCREDGVNCTKGEQCCSGVCSDTDGAKHRVCGCLDDQKLCGTACIPDDACCTDQDCAQPDACTPAKCDQSTGTCQTASFCGAGEACCSAGCTPLTTVTNCGACDHVCPGYQKPNTNVTCTSQGTCTFSCQGNNYDVDADPANGCEQNDPVFPSGPGHTMGTAYPLGSKSCSDPESTFSGVILSDQRTHEIPAVENFNVATGAAPDFWVVNATGGLCEDDVSATITTSGGGNSNCYRLSFIPDNGITQSVVVNGHGTATISGGPGSYHDGDKIYFKIEKTCSTSISEAVSYQVTYHL